MASRSPGPIDTSPSKGWVCLLMFLGWSFTWQKPSAIISYFACQLFSRWGLKFQRVRTSGGLSSCAHLTGSSESSNPCEICIAHQWNYFLVTGKFCLSHTSIVSLLFFSLIPAVLLCLLCTLQCCFTRCTNTQKLIQKVKGARFSG